MGGKVALVTGASRGIGRGIALALAGAGYALAISYYSEKAEAEDVADQIGQRFGRECAVYQADLSQPDVPERLVGDTVAKFGRLDALVNNAGLSSRDRVLDVVSDKMDWIYNLDFRGPVLAAQAAARHMIEQKIPGSIVNITSTRAERAYPDDFLYGGMKAALKRATESMALDLAPHGIRVNCVAPGATIVRTGPRHEEYQRKLGAKIPLGRMGTPEDIGHAVAWLISEKASYITGATIRIDGGLIVPGMPEDVSPAAGYGWGFAGPRA